MATKRADIEANYKASEETNQPVLYDVTYRSNKSFELHVNREVLRFEAGIVNPVSPIEYKKGVPESIINSPEFKVQSQFFNVSVRK